MALHFLLSRFNDPLTNHCEYLQKHTPPSRAHKQNKKTFIQNKTLRCSNTPQSAFMSVIMLLLETAASRPAAMGLIDGMRASERLLWA